LFIAAVVLPAPVAAHLFVCAQVLNRTFIWCSAFLAAKARISRGMSSQAAALPIADCMPLDLVSPVSPSSPRKRRDIKCHIKMRIKKHYEHAVINDASGFRAAIRRAMRKTK
jgi:hypothetical protein